MFKDIPDEKEWIWTTQQLYWFYIHYYLDLKNGYSSKINNIQDTENYINKNLNKVYSKIFLEKILNKISSTQLTNRSWVYILIVLDL